MPPPNRISFRWQRHPGGRPAAPLRTLGLALFRRLGLTGVEVGVLLCDDAHIHALNRDFRHKDAATDVLSFPADFRDEDGRTYLGDIAISLETAARQASAAGWPLARELETLLIHGILHLAGHDHEADDGEMERLEAELRQELLS